MQRYYRKIIQITAEDSPNVQAALEQQRAGLKPDGRQVVPGVLGWDEYRRRRKVWDPIRQCIGLDARFWKGKESFLYPDEWLKRANEFWRAYKTYPSLQATRNSGYGLRELTGWEPVAIGVDPGEGGANTVFSAVARKGLVEMKAWKTPDTSEIRGNLIAFGKRHNVDPGSWILDRGGGGKQIADELRKIGYDVQTLAFGGAVTKKPRRYRASIAQETDELEEKYAYLNQRARFYGDLRFEILDPSADWDFALPPKEEGPEYAELLRQLSLMPLMYDGEGRLKLPPKNKKDPNSKEVTLTQILGASPDEADSLVLGVHGMLYHDPVPEVTVY